MTDTPTENALASVQFSPAAWRVYSETRLRMLEMEEVLLKISKDAEYGAGDRNRKRAAEALRKWGSK